MQKSDGMMYNTYSRPPPQCQYMNGSMPHDFPKQLLISGNSFFCI
jgi:hypothetical protein